MRRPNPPAWALLSLLLTAPAAGVSERGAAWGPYLEANPGVVRGLGLDASHIPVLLKVIDRLPETPEAGSVPPAEQARLLSSAIRGAAAATVVQTVQGARLSEVTTAPPLSRALYLEHQRRTLLDLQAVSPVLKRRGREAIALSLEALDLWLDEARSKLDASQLSALEGARLQDGGDGAKIRLALAAAPKQKGLDRAETRLPTETVKLSFPDLKTYLRRARGVDWRPLLGRHVSVVFKHPRGRRTVDQLVLGRDGLDPSGQEALKRLLGEPRGPEAAFEERGVAMVVTPRRTYYSPVFGSGSDSEIAPAAIEKHLNALTDRVLAAEDEDGVFHEIAFFHTHAGRGTPLSPPDARAIKEIAGQFELGDGQRVRIYAVPVEDGGALLFRKTIFPAP